MLVVSSPPSLNDETEDAADFWDDENLLGVLDFDGFFAQAEDQLPDLEIHPELLSDFSVPAAVAAGEEEESDMTVPTTATSSNSVVSPPELIRDDGTTRKSKTLAGNKKPKKKMAKVDWTPELHRRFVETVEQLGVDKAVPSRILELMGIASLTRHNVASHLQKYRSHQKHLQARGVEAARWNQRAVAGGGFPASNNHWIAAATVPFPPPPPYFRNLHVWGHPPPSQLSFHTWQPQHLSQPHHHLPRPPWFQALPVFGLAPMHHGQGVSMNQTTENVDTAIGDVLSKPWLPMPLGLKPPSVDNVIAELRRQGVSKIPPPA